MPSLLSYSDITNTNDLMSKLDLKDFNRIVVLMQKTVEGVISNFNMDRLQTTGTTCKGIWSLVYMVTCHSRIVQAIIMEQTQ